MPDTALAWNVFITRRPGLTRNVPPGTEALTWVPNSATLITGARDAVLVDTFLTIDACKALVEWVAASRKRLTTIYITHAHGDHCFGIGLLQKRFPGVQAVALPEVVEALRDQISPPRVSTFWGALYAGQIPERLVLPEPLSGNTFELEGERLVAIGLGHTDTDSSSCLHVPSAGLVVAGDAVYNGVHPYQGETDTEGRQAWLAALDIIEALHPRVVIAGHKAPGRDDSPRIIEETREYLQTFDRLVDETSTTRDLYDRMLALYPDRLNPGSLWSAAKLAKPARARTA